MRLLVSCIPYDGGRSGISVYVREVVAALAAQGHELTLLAESGVDIGQLAPGGRFRDAGRRLPNVVQAPRWTRRPALSMLWHLFLLPFWIRRRRSGFDGFVVCAANRRVCAWYPLPTAATVHDLANFHIPGKYSRSRMLYLAHVLPFFAKRARRLVAVSGATKADMVKFWHCRDEDVTVLYNGLRGDWPQAADAAGARDRRAILYVSRIEHPGKNHVRLIEAYGRLPRRLAEAHPLVIAGSDWKDAEAVHEAAAKSPHADLIRFTGFADAATMERLWAETGFYVFPSLFEGFGLSLVEAMAKGIPCACSGNGSLGEIAGDVAITFDPYDADSISAALLKLLEEPREAREARVARGLEHARKFSWEDHAKGLAALLEKAGASGSSGDAGVSRIFGIPVSKLAEAEAVERIIDMAKRRRSPLPAPRPPSFVATLNVDFVANAVSGWPFGGDDELWGYLRNADLVTADGMPIVVLSRLLRRPLPERVTGADMVPAICRRCAEEGLSVYVLGGDRDAVASAFEKLGLPSSGSSCSSGSRTAREPSDILAGHDDSFVALDRDQPEIVGRINAARPDILFVALGNPKQELWMGRNLAKLDVGAAIGVGGTFNFIAGKVRRAPKWMQRCGLEWTYRIVQEPGRLWRRYAYGLVKFSWLSLRALLGGYR